MTAAASAAMEITGLDFQLHFQDLGLIFLFAHNAQSTFSFITCFEDANGLCLIGVLGDGLSVLVLCEMLDLPGCDDMQSLLI